MDESDRPKPIRRRKPAADPTDANAPSTPEPAKPVRRRATPVARNASADEATAAPRRTRAIAPASPAGTQPGEARAPVTSTPTKTPVRRPPPRPATTTPAAETRPAPVPQPLRVEQRPSPPAPSETAHPSAERVVRSTAPSHAAPSVAQTASVAEPLPSFLREKTPAPAPKSRGEARPADSSPSSQRLIHWLIGYLPPQHRTRALNYLVLMRMDRPVGALLLLWPTWWALWFASNDFPSPGLLVIFTLGVFVMRSAGCVINDYADHEWLDAHVERTRGRPMAAGRVTRREALILFGALLALAFVLVLFTNRLTIELSFIGAALAAVYPFTKRVTHLAQVVLGAAFGWSIPMAFAAVTNSLPPLCWLLFLANVLFSTIYDTEYAMVDREDDLRVGAKSTAILFGDADRAIIGVLMATFLFAMLLAGERVALHWPYYVGLAVAAGLLGWQQWLIRDRSRAHCFAAFRNNNWVGVALWLGLLLALAIR